MKDQPGIDKHLEKKQTPLGEAISKGALGGIVAGLAAHYLSGGKLTFPIFLVVFIFLLSDLKGWWQKLAGFILFVIFASLIVVILGYLKY